MLFQLTVMAVSDNSLSAEVKSELSRTLPLCLPQVATSAPLQLQILYLKKKSTKAFGKAKKTHLNVL